MPEEQSTLISIFVSIKLAFGFISPIHYQYNRNVIICNFELSFCLCKKLYSWWMQKGIFVHVDE